MTIAPRLRIGIAIGAFILLTLVLGNAPSKAADVATGRKIAATKCQMCHGLDGQAKLPEAPNLSGQVELYIAKELNAFRAGARKDETMSLMARTLSDHDIADLAAYYAAIEVKIGKVPGE
jgi:cytochrome c553